ncbi:MAG TPA: type II secretion system F family protein [Candidatus Paceibacterota bacterium]|nr:type II secretion system F family protein [Candidatus Paceibacterota bacterium]
MNGKEQTFFFKRLAYLTNAHVSLVEGLQVLREQTKKKHRSIFDRIVADIEEGQSLSRACAKFPKVFSAFSVSILKVGEGSGSLPMALEYLAAELKKKQQLRAKVVGAFIYPAVITLATFGITAFLLLFLFPKITPIFKSLHADLPLSTRVVMGTSVFVGHYWLSIILFIVVAALGATLASRKSARFRFFIDSASVRIPIVGGMLQSYVISNISRTFGLLLKSGVNIEEAVRITADATPNLAYKREFESLSVAVMRGEQLSNYFTTRHAYFPATFCHLVAVGEKSGTLPETFLYLGEMYDAEVDECTKNLSVLIEPMLMVGMGILVGFIAISIITPIYGITQNLHS